jgi:uncharacterized membrane protein
LVDTLAFFALLLAGLIFGLPIAALVASSRAKDAVAKANEELRQIREVLAQHQRRGEELERRVTAWVAYFQQQLAERPSPPVSPAAVTPEIVSPSVAAPAPAAEEVGADRETPPATQFEPGPARAPEPAPDKPRRRLDRLEEARRGGPAAESSPLPMQSGPAVDWERLVGVRLFAWLGGGALFLAAALFLHYSIQRNLISPEVRVSIGLVAGALALVGGDRLRVRTPLAGDAISGAGVGTLYAALFAARVLYDLVDTGPAFAGMVLVTVTAGTLAVRREAYFIALLGLVGGMATPYLLSSGHDRPVALFLYVALLSAGVLFVARLRRWPSLGLIALGLATLLFAGWSSKYLSASRVPYALGAVALVSVLFALTRFQRSKPADEDGPRFPVETTLSLAGLLVPFLVAIGVTQSLTLHVEPFPLAMHLVVVSGVAVWVARVHELEHVPLAAAVLSVLALVGVAGSTEFPEDFVLSFSSLSLVPLAFAAAAVVLRKRPEGTPLYRASLVALGGALLLLLRAAGNGLRDAELAIPLIYVGAHAVCLVGLAYLRSSGIPLLVSQALFVLGSVVVADVTLHNHVIGGVLLGSGVVFFALPAVHVRFRGDRPGFVSAAAALPSAFLCAYALAREAWGYEALGTIAVGHGGLAVAMLAFLRRPGSAPKGDELALRATFGAETLGFLTASVAILLRNEWLTISWALEVAAVAWLYRRLPHRGLVWFAALLAAAVSVRLLVNPALWEYHPRGSIRILNHYLYTFGVPALAFYAAARLFPPDGELARWRLRGLLQIAATAFLFLLMNVEIADFYSTGDHLSFRWSGGGLAEDMTYSLGWGAFAMTLLLAGMAFKKRAARIGSLVVLIMTIAKVFLHDLWELGSLYRVGSIVGLAVALLGVSFLTQRFILPKERS